MKKTQEMFERKITELAEELEKIKKQHKKEINKHKNKIEENEETILQVTNLNININ